MTPLPAVPRLLVSVRSPEEAVLALNAGVDILDVKEPNAGSLGRATFEVVEGIARELTRFDSTIPLSMAMGELSEWDGEPLFLPHGVTFAKVGLARQPRQEWKTRWRQFRVETEAVSGLSCRWIAVAYADHVAAEAPVVEAVLDAAIETDCAGLLIDTYGKGGGSLLQHLALERLGEIVRRAREHGLLMALAGQIRREHLPDILPLQPDVIAVRSAVCRGQDRTATLCAQAIGQFRQALSQPIVNCTGG